MEIVFESPIQTEVDHTVHLIWWLTMGLSLVFFFIHMVGRSYYEGRKLEVPKLVRLSEGLFLLGAGVGVASTVTWLLVGERVIRPRFAEPTFVVGKIESCDIRSSAHSNIITVRAVVDKEICAGKVEYAIPDSQFPRTKGQRPDVPPGLAKLRPGDEVVFSKFTLQDEESNRAVLFLNPD